MKVNRIRPGHTLCRAAGAHLCLVLAASALLGSPAVQAQSAGIGRLMHGGEFSAERSRQHDSRRHADRDRERHRAEREGNERGGHGDRLSPDERRRLRQSLYDLGREMYGGG